VGNVVKITFAENALQKAFFNLMKSPDFLTKTTPIGKGLHSCYRYGTNIEIWYDFRGRD
jgi:hypothetical protein